MRAQLTSKYQRSIELFSFFFSAANDDALLIRMTYSAVLIVALLSIRMLSVKCLCRTSLTFYCRLVLINHVLFIRFRSLFTDNDTNINSNGVFKALPFGGPIPWRIVLSAGSKNEVNFSSSFFKNILCALFQLKMNSLFFSLVHVAGE